ncbi:MAG: chromosomal replication initiator DnaA [Brevundimonas sp.]|uniref:chromosomal replication initiator DnaA n=1 Tax=Brevundimonas sp. TaxID=1871086 RepID=UPI00391CA631
MQEAYLVPVGQADRIKADLAVHLVAAAFGVPAERMMVRGRAEPVACHARRVAIYLVHVTYGWTLERVGHVFRVNRATAGAACRWVEDRRDEPDFDRAVEQLGETLIWPSASPVRELLA